MNETHLDVEIYYMACPTLLENCQEYMVAMMVSIFNNCMKIKASFWP